MTAFTYAQAQHEHPSRNWSGYCLIFVRSAFGVGAKYASATKAWRAAKYRHTVTDVTKIPRGVPVWWTGGSRGYGHVALSRGDGTVWTTDFVRPGKVDVAHIEDITRRWGLRFEGWSEDINGVRVYTPRTKPARPSGPTNPAKPTRVSKARSKIDEALELLNAAVRNGRKGRVRIARDALRDARNQTPTK